MIHTFQTVKDITGFQLILGFYTNDFSNLFKGNERFALRSVLFDKGITTLRFTHTFRLRHYQYIRQHFHMFSSYKGSHLEQPLREVKRRKLKHP